MLVVFGNPNLSAFSSANPSLWNLLLLGARTLPSLPLPRPFSSPFRLSITRAAPLMASPKVVAEYAKSGRSACKGCGKNIPAGSLRLGLSTKDPRGFDMTKWHHLDCFPAASRSLASAEIKGYSLLKVSDQEALRNLEVAAATKSSIDEGCGAGEDGSEGSKKTVLKKIMAGGTVTEEDDERVLKKPKHEDGKEGEEIVFSISDIKSNYKDASLPPKWKAFQTVIFREADDDLRDSDKIAAFDFDGCLVNTSLKRIGPDAWSLRCPAIPEKLQNLYNDGYKLAIFTNESNIERWKNKRQQAVDSKIGRLENFMKLVKVPMQIFIACGLGKSKDLVEDPFRKPKPGMWRILEKHFNSGITIDMDRSFFVGDAAGRSNDHSDADIKFARAVGLKFHVPEDFFGA